MMENRSMRVYCYVLVALFAFFLPSAVYAQSEISVDVEMDEYSLGDHIVFTLSVSDILNESATLTIMHNLQTARFCRNFGTTHDLNVYITGVDSFYLPGVWMMQIESLNVIKMETNDTNS